MKNLLDLWDKTEKFWVAVMVVIAFVAAGVDWWAR